MKWYNKFITLAVVSVLIFSSCEKETTDNISKVVKVSFPEVTINGNPVIHLPQGGTFTDPGAKVKDDVSGQVTDIQATSGSVNTAQAGLYVLQYAASNANGFESLAQRVVTVSSVNNPVDYSGTYLRPATGVNVIISKVATGVYKVQNPGGAATGTDVVVYFVETEPNKFVAPSQPSTAGSFGVNNITFNLPNASWSVVNAGYGTAPRTFIKQ
jgi:hypothetical protein